jgi:hypothetical protein
MSVHVLRPSRNAKFLLTYQVIARFKMFQVLAKSLAAGMIVLRQKSLRKCIQSAAPHPRLPTAQTFGANVL